MAIQIPSLLTRWIDEHEGIVQPYALTQLVQIWADTVKASPEGVSRLWEHELEELAALRRALAESTNDSVQVRFGEAPAGIVTWKLVATPATPLQKVLDSLRGLYARMLLWLINPALDLWAKRRAASDALLPGVGGSGPSDAEETALGRRGPLPKPSPLKRAEAP